jgi:hypothetical protein
MWIFSALKRMLKATFPDPRENSELLEKIRVHSKGEFSLSGEFYLSIECRRNQGGYFGILSISQGDVVSNYYLNNEEFETLARALSKYGPTEGSK